MIKQDSKVMFVKLTYCWRKICVQFVLMNSVSVVYLTLMEDYGEENRCL